MPEGTVALRTLVLVVLLGLSVSARTSARIIRVPADSTSIQSGICGAENGDTVLVAAGTYMENIDFLGKAILVTSEVGPESTIIDGSAPVHPDSGSVVHFVAGEDQNSILDGFTITAGSGTYLEISPPYWAYYGGGIVCARGASPLIRANRVLGNTSEYGGGVGCFYSDPKLIGNVIEHNSAEIGGGLHCWEANAWLEGNVIAENTAEVWGGGLECLFGSSTITGNTIAGNTAAVGGGIYCDFYDGLIERNYISWNYSTWDGGGIESRGYVFRDYGNRDGGGIESRGGEPTIRYNVIERNTGEGLGGGIHCHAAHIEGNRICFNAAHDGGGIWTKYGPATIVDNLVRGNMISHGLGAGICIAGGTIDPTIVVNNLVIENTSGYIGGGVSAGPALIANNTISCNTAPYGGGIFCWVYPNPEFLVITNNIISSNLGGYGIYNDSTFLYCVPDIYYNDVWDNGINYYGCLPGHHDISVDPEFAEPEWGHYSLLPSSPCLDVGDPFLLDPDGTRSNMGAFGGPDAELVHLTFVPEADTIAGGGMLTYEAILSNNFADPLTTYGLTELLMPSGFPSPLNPLIGPMRVTLGPYQTVRKTIFHYVPPAAPEGEYWYTGKVGFPPDVLEDMDAFSFHVAQ